ncbi:MAG: hypothetical protein WBW48_05360, partial [Anaerolineae bacterium]
QSSPISSPDKHYPTIKPCQSLEAVTKTKQHPLKYQQQFLQPPERQQDLTNGYDYDKLNAAVRQGTILLLEQANAQRIQS